MSAYLDQAREAYEAERRVHAANKARETLAHERKALAALAAADAGESPDAIGGAIGLHATDVAELVEEARRLAPALPGRPGRSPQHVVMRYAAGEISRDEMIETLSTWPYAPAGPIAENLLNDFRPRVSGSFDDVRSAVYQGYIDDDAFDAIVERFAAGQQQ
ncbi:hypothetical protein ABZ442_30200 [Streptomyces triculaminicus]|uniref:hypothetical protein n=1 Tax=Streptomyces triculaminicus TaxID=2816232 RepID=UPI003405A253